MRQLTRICIIGGGVLETDGQDYFVKAAVAEYLRELREYFQEVVFIAPVEEGNKYLSKLDNDMIHVVPFGKTRKTAGVGDVLKDLWKSFTVFRSLLDKKTGVIISGVYAGVLGRIILAKIFSCRVIYYVGSDPRLTGQLKAKTFSGYLKRVALRFIFPFSAMLSDGMLVRGQAVYHQAVRWNRNSTISKPLITYSKYRHIDLPREVSISDEFRILFVGKLLENKGVHILIAAFGRLLNLDEKPCRLVIVGSGEEMDRLRELTVQLEIQKHVKFTGYIDDMNSLVTIYYESDVLVVPSIKAEGFPRVIEEAMVCGLPVICSRLGGMKEGLDSDDVVFVDPGSVDELYTALKRVASDRVYRTDLKKKSLERAASILSGSAAEQHAKVVENAFHREGLTANE